MRTTSRFETTAARNAAAKLELEALVAATAATAPLRSRERGIVNALMGRLRASPPGRSAAAEVALVILLIVLAEGRPLNVIDPSAGDIANNNRLEGDRALSDWLSQWLLRRNIPATAGALASNTYRSGYRASQAQSPALAAFVQWLSSSGRSMVEITNVASAVLAGFLANAVDLPDLPRIRHENLTAVRFRQIVESLLATGSQGAFEQYLVAGVLNAEFAATGRDVRAETKAVGASDSSSGTSGDVEIRKGQTLIETIEVTAESWRTKLAQLAAGRRPLPAVTVVATDVQVTTAARFEHELGQEPRLNSVDVRFVELLGFLDFCSARLDGRGRAETVAFVYAQLVRLHRSEPGLVTRLVQALEDAEVVEEHADSPEVTAAAVEADDEVDAAARRLIERLQRGNIRGNPDVAADLRVLLDLASGDNA